MLSQFDRNANSITLEDHQSQKNTVEKERVQFVVEEGGGMLIGKWASKYCYHTASSLANAREYTCETVKEGLRDGEAPRVNNQGITVPKHK